MTQRLSRALGGIAAGVLAVVLLASPAAARTAVFPDHDGGGGTAIQSVWVQNKTKNLYVWLEHKRTLRWDEFYLDTVPRDPGPEYRVQMLANSDVGSIRRVESFHTGKGSFWPCRRWDGHADNYEEDAWSHIRIPQGCLRGPGPVRVAAASEGRHPQSRDSAPNRGTYQGWFTAWVRYGR